MPTKNDDGLITLTSDKVLDSALDALLKEVRLYINDRKCTAENIFEIILKASVGQMSVSDVCDELRAGPSGNAVLAQLHQALPQELKRPWRLEAQLNRVLLTNLPGRMLKVPCDLGSTWCWCPITVSRLKIQKRSSAAEHEMGLPISIVTPRPT